MCIRRFVVVTCGHETTQVEKCKKALPWAHDCYDVIVDDRFPFSWKGRSQCSNCLPGSGQPQDTLCNGAEAAIWNAVYEKAASSPRRRVSSRQYSPPWRRAPLNRPASSTPQANSSTYGRQFGQYSQPASGPSAASGQAPQGITPPNLYPAGAPYGQPPPPPNHHPGYRPYDQAPLLPSLDQQIDHVLQTLDVLERERYGRMYRQDNNSQYRVPIYDHTCRPIPYPSIPGNAAYANLPPRSDYERAPQYPGRRGRAFGDDDPARRRCSPRPSRSGELDGCI